MDWKSSFNPIVLRQGAALIASGQLQSLHRSGQVFSAEFEDGALAQVEIGSSGSVLDLSCDAHPGLCAHEAALLLALENTPDWNAIPVAGAFDEEIPETKSEDSAQSYEEEEEETDWIEKPEPSVDAEEACRQPASSEEHQEETAGLESRSSVQVQQPVLSENAESIHRAQTTGSENEIPEEKTVSAPAMNQNRKPPFIPRSFLQRLDHAIDAASPRQLAAMLKSLAHTSPAAAYQIRMLLLESDTAELAEEICAAADRILYRTRGRHPQTEMLTRLLENEGSSFDSSAPGEAWTAVRYVIDSACEAKLLDGSKDSKMLCQTAMDIIGELWTAAPFSLKTEILDWISGILEKLRQEDAEIFTAFLMNLRDEQCSEQQIRILETVLNNPSLPRPAKQEIFSSLLALYTESGNRQSLEALYENAADDPVLMEACALYLLENGQASKAASLLGSLLRTPALKLQPPVSLLRLNAQALEASGQKEQAAAAWMQLALRKDPDTEDLLALLALTGNTEFETLLPRIENSLSLWQKKKIHAALGHKEELMDLLEKDLYEGDLRTYESMLKDTFRPRLAACWRKLADEIVQSADSKEQYRKALAMLEESVRLDPQGKEARAALKIWKKDYPHHRTLMHLIEDFEKIL